MTKQIQRNGGRKSTEVRQSEIADVAMRILAEQGVKRFTAKIIAQEIGISDAAVFRHFPTKEAIVAALIERMEAILFEGFPPTDDDPLQRLGAFFGYRVKAIHNHPHLSRLLLSDQLAYAAGPDSMARITEFKKRSRNFILACLKEAKERGLLADGVGLEEVMVLVQGAVLALSHSGETAQRVPGLDELSGRIWVLIEQVARRGKSPALRHPAKTTSTIKARQRTQSTTKNSIQRRAK